MNRWTPLAILMVNGLAFSQPVTSSQPATREPATPAQPAVSDPWEVLKSGLQDGDADHRKQAIGAVGTIGARRDAVQLVEQGLQDKNMLVRQEAAATLGEMGSSDAIPALTAALDDGPEVSFTAAKSLFSLGDASGREFLWQVLKGERKDTPSFLDGALRSAKHKLRSGEFALMGAKEAAGLFGPGAIAITAVQEVVKENKKSSGALGRVVVAGLLTQDPDPYNRILLEWALGDDSSQVRVAVAKALGECGNRDTIAKLTPLLSDDRHAVRYMAAASIIKLNLKFPAAN